MPLSGAEMRRRFEGEDWAFDHQTGSHMILKKEGRHVSIPNHRELGKGLETKLLKILRGEK